MKLIPFGIAVLFAAAIPAAGHAKTVAQCNAEYTANKAAIQASGERKRDFMTRCRAETGAATAPLPPKGSAAATAAPPPAAGETPSRRARAGAPTRANEFATEAEAKAHCPGDSVVWANTKTHIYHFPGTRSYGRTKAGAYVCERDAGALGIRAARNERRQPRG